MGVFTVALGIYALGVLVGLAATDARPATRAGLAVLWPIGPLAFVVTVAVLLLSAVVPLSGLVRRGP